MRDQEVDRFGDRGVTIVTNRAMPKMNVAAAMRAPRAPDRDETIFSLVGLWMVMVMIAFPLDWLVTGDLDRPARD